MFELFTGDAKRALTVSQDEALSLGHDFIGTEHLLLGLAGTAGATASEVLGDYGITALRAREETVRMLAAAGVSGVGGQAAKDDLATLGIDVEEIKRRADDTLGPGRFPFPRPAFTLRAKKVMEMTLRESRALGHEHIDTEHLLLGLLAEEAAHSEADGGDPGPGPAGAARVLEALGVDAASLRTSVLTRIGPPVGSS